MDLDSRYKMLEKIGSGSFATVYRARDLELVREVAVKQIHEEYLNLPEKLDRYWQEAQLLASLQHPNIVTIFDIDRGRGCLIMELMQANLAQRMAGRQMDLRSLRTTIAHCLRALKYLHSCGIVHSDIKPSNMMLDARRRIKLGDFGLARRVSDAEGSLLKGTTKYMAPEVVSDEFGEVGPQSDLYSLGFSAFDLMCGPKFESLFPGLSAFGRNKQVAWMMWHVAADRRLPEIKRVLEGVPEDLAQVIQKLTQKDQSKRYQTADEALSDLNIDVKIVTSGDVGDDMQQTAKDPAERKRRMLAIGAFAVSLILCLVMLLDFGGNGGPVEKSNIFGIVRKVNADENRIVIEDEEGIPQKFRIVKDKPRIFLVDTEKHILLEELQPGDRVEIEETTGEDGKTIVSLKVSRPEESKGRIKTIDLQNGRIVFTIEEGDSRDDLPLRIPKRAEVLLNG